MKKTYPRRRAPGASKRYTPPMGAAPRIDRLLQQAGPELPERMKILARITADPSTLTEEDVKILDIKPLTEEMWAEISPAVRSTVVKMENIVDELTRWEKVFPPGDHGGERAEALAYNIYNVGGEEALIELAHQISEAGQRYREFNDCSALAHTFFDGIQDPTGEALVLWIMALHLRILPFADLWEGISEHFSEHQSEKQRAATGLLRSRLLAERDVRIERERQEREEREHHFQELADQASLPKRERPSPDPRLVQAIALAFKARMRENFDKVRDLALELGDEDWAQWAKKELREMRRNS